MSKKKKMEDIRTKVQTYSGHVVWSLFPVNASPSVLGLPLGTSRYKAYMGVSEEMLCLWFVGFAAHGAASLLCERPTLT